VRLLGSVERRDARRSLDEMAEVMRRRGRPIENSVGVLRARRAVHFGGRQGRRLGQAKAFRTHRDISARSPGLLLTDNSQYRVLPGDFLRVVVADGLLVSPKRLRALMQGKQRHRRQRAFQRINPSDRTP
jgi:hypothetical protein